jgi:hypothetical protein
MPAGQSISISAADTDFHHRAAQHACREQMAPELMSAWNQYRKKPY